MRQPTTAVVVAAVAVLVGACGGSNQSGPASSSTSATTTTSTRPPVAQPALAGLLLTTAEIDGVLGVTGTSTKSKADKLPDDSTKPFAQGWKWPADCLFAFDPGEAPVYANSGYTAANGEDDVASLPPSSNDIDPEVTQVVVLFPSADQANAFFSTSAQAWPACANRQFTAPGDADNPEVAVKIGPVNNANSTLTTVMTLTLSNGSTTITGACQRALTVRNNVAIDVSACRNDPGDVGVKIANQIAGKVDKQ